MPANGRRDLIRRLKIKKCFSYNFERTGSKLTGLKIVTSLPGFPDFRIVMIWETFRWPGKYPVLNTLLNMTVIALIPTYGDSFKILPVIRSCPGAFCGRSFLITDLSLVNLNILTGFPGGHGFRGHVGFPVLLLLTSQKLTA